MRFAHHRHGMHCACTDHCHTRVAGDSSRRQNVSPAMLPVLPMSPFTRRHPIRRRQRAQHILCRRLSSSVRQTVPSTSTICVNIEFTDVQNARNRYCPSIAARMCTVWCAWATTTMSNATSARCPLAPCVQLTLYLLQGCGLQLTDEPHSACYPIQEHLLCKSCHIHWSRTGGLSQPITDL